MHLSDVKRDKNYGFREMMYDIDAVFIPRKSAQLLTALSQVRVLLGELCVDVTDDTRILDCTMILHGLHGRSNTHILSSPIYYCA